MENVTNLWAEYNPIGLVPSKIVNRYDDKVGNRFYYFKENGQYQAAAGITTWLGRVMPESPFLTEWKMKWGKEWKTLLNLTADYGSLFHACVAQMMINNAHPEDHLIDAARSVLKEMRRFDKACTDDMIDKNIISFQKFREDYNLRPLLVEALLICRACTGDYYCLTQDLLAEIEYDQKIVTQAQDGVYSKGKNKGEPKMVNETAYVRTKEVICLDFKTNPFNKEKKSFFESNKLQLIGTKKAVEQNFDIKVDRIFNWSPNNWRSTIGDYNLHEWKIESRDIELFQLYEQLASKTGAFRPSGGIQVFEPYEAGKKAEDMFKSYSYIEYVEKLGEQEVESNVMAVSE